MKTLNREVIIRPGIDKGIQEHVYQNCRTSFYRLLSENAINPEQEKIKFYDTIREFFCRYEKIYIEPGWDFARGIWIEDNRLHTHNQPEWRIVYDLYREDLEKYLSLKERQISTIDEYFETTETIKDIALNVKWIFTNKMNKLTSVVNETYLLKFICDNSRTGMYTQFDEKIKYYHQFPIQIFAKREFELPVLEKPSTS